MDFALRARSLYKSFHIYRRSRDIVREFLTRRVLHTDFAALTDVSFEIPRGEIVGILGRNGAGKSTLLKLIAGTLEPSSGACEVRGRLSAILELGTGFHADYSGRENAYLGAICLGMSRRDARARLDSILAFAEIGDFVDRPFRTYSSGMQARLTFATAVAATPEVLIVDEALSVGDARFQLRCFDRIREMRDQGCTILFVSHSMEQVTNLCDRALLLERGRLVSDGDPAEVTRAYHRLLFGASDRPAAAGGVAPSAGPERVESEGWRMGPAVLVDSSGTPVETLEPRGQYEIRFIAEGGIDVPDLCVALHVRNRQGTVVYGIDPRTTLGAGFGVRAGERLGIRIRFTCHFGGSCFFASYGLVRSDGTALDFRHDALELRVAADQRLQHASIVDIDASVSCERVQRA